MEKQSAVPARPKLGASALGIVHAAATAWDPLAVNHRREFLLPIHNYETHISRASTARMIRFSLTRLKIDLTTAATHDYALPHAAPS
jgi:hypothetical protein